MEIEIAELQWDSFNVEHVESHVVTIVEIEEACQNQLDTLTSYDNRQMLFGKTIKGRYLTVILSKAGINKYYVVTARDTSKKERNYVRQKEK